MDANEEIFAGLLSQGDADPFELAMLEVDDEADGKLGNTQVVHHLAPLMIGNPLDCLGVHDDPVVGDDVLASGGWRVIGAEAGVPWPLAGTPR